MVRRIPVPAAVLDLQLLERVDYADAFAAPTTGTHTPLEWAALMHEHAHPAVMVLVRWAHRHVARMDLVPADADHPLGWQVLDRTDERLVLATSSSLITPRVVAVVERDRLVLTTLLRHDSRLARVMWAGLRHVHRPVARYLLATMARHG